MNNKIYLPYCGIYTEVITAFFNTITKTDIIIITNNDNLILNNRFLDIPKTIKIKVSTIINALNNGSNYIIDIETGIIAKYYSLLETEILEKLGYTFQLIKLTKNDHLSLIKTYKFAKYLNNNLNHYVFLKEYIRLIQSVYLIHKYGMIIKAENIKLLNKMNIIKLIKIELYNRKCKLKKIIENRTKILIVNTSHNYINILQKLKNKKITVFTIDNLQNIIMPITIQSKPFLSKSYKYIRYSVANNSRNIVIDILRYIKKGINGIIYIYDDFCPENNNMLSTINYIANDNNIPIINIVYSDYNMNKKINYFCSQLTDSLK